MRINSEIFKMNIADKINTEHDKRRLINTLKDMRNKKIISQFRYERLLSLTEIYANPA